ncbi:thiamine biosynthesis/tRNA modification protein ThiI [Clostridiales bacterium KA00134]|nr:thiamine biosynthesis/tRNA modification protein ThiI [Clostridiales bacterium KA00134]
MEKLISASLGEIVLKGNNRKSFVDRLLANIKRVLNGFNIEKIYKESGKIYIKLDDNSDEEDAIAKLQHVFGIIYISPVIKISKDLDEIKFHAKELVQEAMNENPSLRTFKAQTKRGDKKYPLTSMEVNNEIGGAILKEGKLKVDVHNPDLYVYCDIKKDAYLYYKKIRAHGGLPSGSNGRGLLLLSGGIDSPVAGFYMSKRGIRLDGVHFHSYPFTSERGEKKVLDLAEILSTYNGPMRVYSVNLLPIQKEINKNCPEDEMTIISRRFMMRIAKKLAEKFNYTSITTGENLGQVASQTVEGITVTNEIPDIPVFRPLIGFDKVDIMDKAREIGTYETSILPFEDCCTVFLPKHPNLRPTSMGINKSEENLDIEKLVEEAVDAMKVYKIGY